VATLVNFESIGSGFESLSNPRHTRNRKHLLIDVIVIDVGGMLCGSDGSTAILRRAASRLDGLRPLLALPNGIPSRDCIRRLLIALQADNRGPRRLERLALADTLITINAMGGQGQRSDAARSHRVALRRGLGTGPEGSTVPARRNA
jgi:hypothetical protein